MMRSAARFLLLFFFIQWFIFNSASEIKFWFAPPTFVGSSFTTNFETGLILRGSSLNMIFDSGSGQHGCGLFQLLALATFSTGRQRSFYNRAVGSLLHRYSVVLLRMGLARNRRF
jgi:hypothetical protein